MSNLFSGLGATRTGIPYTGIPYQYGGRSLSGADCFGVCWLYMISFMAIPLPAYDEFYLINPDYDRLSVRSAIKMLLQHGFTRSLHLSEGCLLLGIFDGRAGFGLWLGGSVLTSCKEAGSYIARGDDWLRGTDKVFMFLPPPQAQS